MQGDKLFSPEKFLSLPPRVYEINYVTKKITYSNFFHCSVLAVGPEDHIIQSGTGYVV